MRVSLLIVVVVERTVVDSKHVASNTSWLLFALFFNVHTDGVNMMMGMAMDVNMEGQ